MPHIWQAVLLGREVFDWGLREGDASWSSPPFPEECRRRSQSVPIPAAAGTLARARYGLHQGRGFKFPTHRTVYIKLSTKTWVMALLCYAISLSWEKPFACTGISCTPQHIQVHLEHFQAAYIMFYNNPPARHYDEWEGCFDILALKNWGLCRVCN